jgi:hypothetical protein
MSPEAQRIAIAEACGWTKYDGPEKFQFYSPGGMYARATDIPNYLNDFNAMNAALKSQTQTFRSEFDRLLHAMAEDKHLLVSEFEAKDWADCFISCLQPQREGGY